jgi:putative transposase
MNDDSIFSPRVGMRFAMRGSEYEVCFAQYGVVRYASVNGGNPYRLQISKFQDYQVRKEIKIQQPDLYKEDQIQGCDDGGYAPASLSQRELAEGMRRIRYAEAATIELLHPNSDKEITEWLPDCATRLKDENPPTPRSVSSWVKTYREKGRDALFAPERKRGNRTLQFSPEIHLFMLEAIDEYLSQ